jgi:hypothetical protein
MKKNEMGTACSAYGEQRCIEEFGGEIGMKETTLNTRVYGRIILNWILGSRID